MRSRIISIVFHFKMFASNGFQGKKYKTRISNKNEAFQGAQIDEYSVRTGRKSFRVMRTFQLLSILNPKTREHFFKKILPEFLEVKPNQGNYFKNQN